MAKQNDPPPAGTWKMAPSEIREELLAARAAGKSFGAAWGLLMHSGRLNADDIAVLRATRRAWRDAYEGRSPARQDSALQELAA